MAHISDELPVSFFEVAILSNVARWIHLIVIFQGYEKLRQIEYLIVVAVVALSVMLIGVVSNLLGVECSEAPPNQHINRANYT
jgi:hypothetical protein